MKEDNLCPLESNIKTRTPCQKSCRHKCLAKKDLKISKDCCPWYVDSPQHLNCFWLFLLDKENQTGFNAQEIGDILGINANNAKNLEKTALKKLQHYYYNT